MGGESVSAGLANRVAIVTGSTSGIGRASAELFSEEGASVVINGRRRDLGRQVAEGIVSRGGSASYCFADVTKGDQLLALIRHAMDTYGRLDILMNNAYSGHSASVVDLEAQDWDEVFAASIKAAFLGCKYAIPEMIASGGGSIISVTSVQGLLGARSNVVYNTAKSALIDLTRRIAVD